jgi:hypothetical protein
VIINIPNQSPPKHFKSDGALTGRALESASVLDMLDVSLEGIKGLDVCIIQPQMLYVYSNSLDSPQIKENTFYYLM